MFAPPTLEKTLNSKSLATNDTGKLILPELIDKSKLLNANEKNHVSRIFVYKDGRHRRRTRSEPTEKQLSGFGKVNHSRRMVVRPPDLACVSYNEGSENWQKNSNFNCNSHVFATSNQRAVSTSPLREVVMELVTTTVPDIGSLQGSAGNTNDVAISAAAVNMDDVRKRAREEQKKDRQKKKDDRLWKKHQHAIEMKCKAVAQSPCKRWVKHNIKVGEGSYKRVYRGYDREQSRDVAWCELKLDSNHAVLDDATRQQVLHEVDIMINCEHTNIVQYYDMFEYFHELDDLGEIQDRVKCIVIIMEFMGEGTLKNWIKKIYSKDTQRQREASVTAAAAVDYVANGSKKDNAVTSDTALDLSNVGITEALVDFSVLKDWMRQILDGLRYMHHTKQPPVIHRDLKPENIFISDPENSELPLQVKIGDFGLSTWKTKSRKTMIGTLAYMAPEFFKESYDEKVDVYAFAVLTLELLTNSVPYQECSQHFFAMMKKIISGTPPETMSLLKDPEARSLIELCMCPLPVIRPNCLELLSQPLFNMKSLPVSVVVLKESSGDMEDARLIPKHMLYCRLFINEKRLQASMKIIPGEGIDFLFDALIVDQADQVVEDMHQDETLRDHLNAKIMDLVRCQLSVLQKAVLHRMFQMHVDVVRASQPIDKLFGMPDNMWSIWDHAKLFMDRTMEIYRRCRIKREDYLEYVDQNVENDNSSLKADFVGLQKLSAETTSLLGNDCPHLVHMAECGNDEWVAYQTWLNCMSGNTQPLQLTRYSESQAQLQQIEEQRCKSTQTKSAMSDSVELILSNKELVVEEPLTVFVPNDSTTLRESPVKYETTSDAMVTHIDQLLPTVFHKPRPWYLGIKVKQCTKEYVRVYLDLPLPETGDILTRTGETNYRQLKFDLNRADPLGESFSSMIQETRKLAVVHPHVEHQLRVNLESMVKQISLIDFQRDPEVKIRLPSFSTLGGHVNRKKNAGDDMVTEDDIYSFSSSPTVVVDQSDGHFSDARLMSLLCEANACLRSGHGVVLLPPVAEMAGAACGNACDDPNAGLESYRLYTLTSSNNLCPLLLHPGSGAVQQLPPASLLITHTDGSAQLMSLAGYGSTPGILVPQILVDLGRALQGDMSVGVYIPAEFQGPAFSNNTVVTDNNKKQSQKISTVSTFGDSASSDFHPRVSLQDNLAIPTSATNPLASTIDTSQAFSTVTFSTGTTPISSTTVPGASAVRKGRFTVSSSAKNCAPNIDSISTPLEEIALPLSSTRYCLAASLCDSPDEFLSASELTPDQCERKRLK